MFLEPMLFEGYDEPFDDQEFIFEPKIDGCRLIYSQINKITELYSRFQQNVTPLFPELYHINIDDDVVLDGVAANVNPQTGRIDYDCINHRIQIRNFSQIQQLSRCNPCQYIVFDILHYKGRDLRGLPLMKRREILQRLDFGNRNIGLVPFVENDGSRLFEEIQQRKMHGMVAKRKDSLYMGQRSDTWLKIISWQHENFYITGYQKQQFGIRLSVLDRGTGFREVGIVTSGLTLIDQLTLLTVSKDIAVNEDNNLVSVRPVMKARIKFENYTRDGKLGSPYFVGFVL